VSDEGKGNYFCFDHFFPTMSSHTPPGLRSFLYPTFVVFILLFASTFTHLPLEKISVVHSDRPDFCRYEFCSVNLVNHFTLNVSDPRSVVTPRINYDVFVLQEICVLGFFFFYILFIVSDKEGAIVGVMRD
jgi:hypothetical protein